MGLHVSHDDPYCQNCQYDERMARLPGYPSRHLMGYCAEHGPQRTEERYVNNETTPRRVYRFDSYGVMAERTDGTWESLPNGRVDSRPPQARRTGACVPMAADVLSEMRSSGVDQDEAVRRLGGTP